jgi:predicted transcriptional regulator
MLIDKVCCPKCNGVGQIELRDLNRDLAETLKVVREYAPMTATDVASRLKPTPQITAVNNRLERLRALGFVERRKSAANHKQWVYYVIFKWKACQQ